MQEFSEWFLKLSRIFMENLEFLFCLFNFLLNIYIFQPLKLPGLKSTFPEFLVSPPQPHCGLVVQNGSKMEDTGKYFYFLDCGREYIAGHFYLG